MARLSPQLECQTAADCSSGGEFPVGTRLHAGCDGGVSCGSQAVDPSCGTDAGQVYPPFVPLAAPDVPADCKNGFQLTDTASTFVYGLESKTVAGSRALMPDLDIATYSQADGIQITDVDGDCKQHTLFETCRLEMRPQDIAIRPYHLELHPGTTQLSIGFGRVVSPMYVQILGLCDFKLPTPPPSSDE